MSRGKVHDFVLLGTEHVGVGTRIWTQTHILHSACIGRGCNICDQTFIENDVIIRDYVTIKSGVHIWDGVRIKDDVFIGPSVVSPTIDFQKQVVSKEISQNGYSKRG